MSGAEQEAASSLLDMVPTSHTVLSQSPGLRPLGLADRRVSDLSEYSRSSTPHIATPVNHGSGLQDGEFIAVRSDSVPVERDTEWGLLKKKEPREDEGDGIGFDWVPYYACVEEGVFAWYNHHSDVVSQGSVTMPYLRAEVDDSGRFLRVRDLAPGESLI